MIQFLNYPGTPPKASAQILMFLSFFLLYFSFFCLFFVIFMTVFFLFHLLLELFLSFLENVNGEYRHAGYNFKAPSCTPTSLNPPIFSVSAYRGILCQINQCLTPSSSLRFC